MNVDRKREDSTAAKKEMIQANQLDLALFLLLLTHMGKPYKSRMHCTQKLEWPMSHKFRKRSLQKFEFKNHHTEIKD